MEKIHKLIAELHGTRKELKKKKSKSCYVNSAKKQNKIIGKNRNHFKKIRDIKGTFHAKMGIIKDRNSMHLTEAEDIKKRWQIHRRTIQETSS